MDEIFRGSQELIDVLHLVLLLWEKSRREEMIKVLGMSGYGTSEAFYRVTQAVSETLPVESKEKKLLDGFLTGRERIREEVIKVGQSSRAPVLILIDELIPYLNTADAVAVGNVSLTTLALTFLHNLTNVVSGMPAVSLVVTTTPSNPYNRTPRGEEIVADLQNITARREIIKSPVQEQEITQVIKRRLFSHIDREKTTEVIKNFMDYATKESILPVGTEPSAYRKRFESAYPFLPEVIDVLYHRWGSFTNFQRTRGVLRLLSLVVHSLKESSLPFISLADFNLNNQEIRRELLKHTGPEFDSIVAADITGEEAGSKKVEASMGDAYKGLRLGTRAAVTIFLYSFSGGPERGVTLGELKRTATTVGNPASVVAEVVEQLKDRLFYIQHQSGKYYFTNKPNLNLILRNRMENIQEKEMAGLEKDLLKKNLAGGKLKTFLWPQENSEIPDNIELKLIVLKKQDDAFMKQALETKGGTPRVNRNTLFFLTPLFSEQGGFASLLKKFLAYRLIGSDKTLNLSEDQKKEIKDRLKEAEEALPEALRRCYRLLFRPVKDGFAEMDLGIPTYGIVSKIDEEAYEKLRSEGHILERIVPLIIKERYLKSNTHVLTEQLYQAGAKTPGETRVLTREVWEKGIEEGVQQGLFGLGELKDGQPVCHFFKLKPSVALAGGEIIIRAGLCPIPEKKEKEGAGITVYPQPPGDQRTVFAESGSGEGTGELFPDGKTPIPGEQPALRREVCLKFALPKGKVAGLMGVMNLLQSKFNTLEVELKAAGGEISEQDFEDKIKESFRQLGIELD